MKKERASRESSSKGKERISNYFASFKQPSAAAPHHLSLLHLILISNGSKDSNNNKHRSAEFQLRRPHTQYIQNRRM